MAIKIPDHIKSNSMQSEGDLEELLEISKELGVKKVLEIGTAQGGTAAAFTFIGAEVVTVDCFEKPPAGGWLWDQEGFEGKVTFIHANSLSFETKDRVQDEYDLVVIDGEHSLLSGYMDWKNYACMGKYVAIHDIVSYNTQPDDEDWFPRIFWKMVVKDRLKRREIINTAYGGWGLLWMTEKLYTKMTKKFERFLLKLLK